MSGLTFDPVQGPRERMLAQDVSAKDKARSQAGRLRPTRDVLVDLAFAVALVGLALLGMRTGYFGWPWVSAGVAGVVVGILLAHLTASFRLPAAVTLLALAAAYLLLGGPLAVRNKLIGGVLPSKQTFHDLLRAPVHGWKEWLTTLPPVDAAGPLLALPFLVGLVGAALTYAVARRFTNPYVVVVAPLALLAGSIGLGTQTAAGTTLQGAVAGLLLIGWMVVRAHRNRPPLQNGAGKQSRLAIGTALVAAAGVVGLLGGPHLPGGASGDERVVARAYLTPPFDVAQLRSPLAGFRQYTKPNAAKLFDKTILTVRGLPAGTPVRLATLDNYDGSVWGAGNRSNEGTPDPGKAFQQVGSRVASNAAGTPVTLKVTVPQGGYTGVWLPTAGTVTGVRFAGKDADDLQANLWLNTDTNTAVVPAGLRGGETYDVSAIVPQAPVTKLPTSLGVASGSLTDAGQTSFLDSRIDAWTGNATDQWQKLAAVAGYMNGEGAYTDGGEPNSVERYYLAGHGLGRLGRFAGGNQLAGDDEQYAATLALTANRLNIPARVVMGAIPEADGTIKGSDVHAWVEVQQSDESWFSILPSTFLPDRTKTPNQQQVRNDQKKTGAQVPPPSGVNPPSILQGPDQAQNATNLKKIKKSALNPSTWPLWLRVLVFYVVLPLLVLALLFGLVVLLKFRRSRSNLTRGPTPHRIALIWRDLMADAKDVGVPLPRLATRLEQARAFPAPEPVWELAHHADHYVFGAGSPSDEQVRDFWDRARVVRRDVLAAAPRWRRLFTAADPRPLFAKDPARARTTTTGDRFGRLRGVRRPRSA